MDDGRNQDTFSIAKFDLKQRIAEAKIRAAEKRAAEIAARRAKQQVTTTTTPSPTPFPTSPFIIKIFTPSISSHAPESTPLLRSPTTRNERVERANSLEALSKKIDSAGNFQLQELITKMILKCPGAKEVAESFFLLNDVQSDNEEFDEREKSHEASRSDGHGEKQNVHHVTFPQSPSGSTTPKGGRIQSHAFGTQRGCQACFQVSDQRVGEMIRREEDVPSALHPTTRPESSSMLHSNEILEQQYPPQENNQSNLMEIEDLITGQASVNDVRNLRKDNTATVPQESETSTLPLRNTREGFDPPIIEASIANISGPEISTGLDMLLSDITISCETSNHDSSSCPLPQIASPRVNENAATLSSFNIPTGDMSKLANEISAKYIALARVSGPANFPYDQHGSMRSGPSPNNLTNEFSFEAFNSLIDSVRENIEIMQRTNKANTVHENGMTLVSGKDSTDLTSPISTEVNSGGLSRDSILGDGTNHVVQEAIDSAESPGSEEDEYAELANITSSHYNCDSCRKPIVLPEGFVVTPEDPPPTTCLHCTTRKASRIARRKLGARGRSNISTEIPTSRADAQSPYNQVGHGTKNPQTPGQTSNNISNILQPPSNQSPELFQQLPPGPVPGHLEQFSTPIQAVERNFGEAPKDTELRRGPNIKDENIEDTIVVDIPTWRNSETPPCSASQPLAENQSLPSSKKRKIEEIDGEIIYPFPIGPKRRRGRPLKNYFAILSDSSPISPRQVSTPVSTPGATSLLNPSSQGTPSGKKRGRPLGSKNRFKSEARQPNSLDRLDRRAALKSQELTKSLLNAPPDFMPDVTYYSGSPSHNMPSHFDTKSIVPESRATSDLDFSLTTTPSQQDSGSEYIPPREWVARRGNDPTPKSIPDGDGSSSSLGSMMSSDLEIQRPAPAITERREKETPRTHDQSFGVDQQLRKSIEGQENQVAPEPISLAIGGNEKNADDCLTGSSEESRSVIERGVESYIGSMTNEIRRSFGEGSDLRLSDSTRRDSNMAGELQAKDGDSVAQYSTTDPEQSRPQLSCLRDQQA
ncbi:hypothetical protein NHQ30_008407 [Ciborinia camelliae]|nr:hypothetical protein NHQ30_008407 [Ciborinia camelliae]